MTKKIKPSMLGLVANCLEMWDRYKSGGYIEFQGKKLYFINNRSFLHYIWRKDTIKYLDGLVEEV